MRRFFVPPQCWGTMLTLPPEQAHHALTVLRLKPGDLICCFDGQGHEVSARLLSLSPETGEAERLGEVISTSSRHKVVIGQGLPKGDKLEQVIQHGTELGMSSLVPLALSRCVVKIEPAKQGAKRERWQRIAEEAAKQCRRADVPEIEAVQPLSAFCQRFAARPGPVLGLVLYEDATHGIPLRIALERLEQASPSTPIEIWALIGPEGGLTAGEVQQAREAGFLCVTLGRRILRTETAPLALLAILQYEYDA